MPCVACSRPTAPWRTASASDARLSTRARYRLVRCAACGTAAIADEERAIEEATLYTAGTYGRPGALERLIEPLRQLIDRDRLRLIGPLPPHADVLEIGAGDGRLLAALARRGHRVAGIEPAAPFAARARERGMDVEAVAIEDATRPASSCDVVVLWHVLEHLDDPVAALARAHGWLRADGRLVVAVPNLASWQARLGGDRWFHQDVPRHLTHFTPAGLRSLLERRGFRVVRVRQLMLEHNALGMWQTLLNRITRERDVAFRLLKRARSEHGAADPLLTVALGVIAMPFAVGLEALAALCGRGGTMVVLATRV